jgi:SAM-dependent methyltransferase
MSTTTHNETITLPPALQQTLTERARTVFASYGYADSFEEMAELDPHPLPIAAQREWYNYNSDLFYWLNGLRDAKRLVEHLKPHVDFDQPAIRVLDFGSASGRVIRHLACQSSLLPETTPELFATDTNVSHIEWIAAHLPSTIHAVACTMSPGLPAECCDLDLVYAYSVMTHIAVDEREWLEVLHGALKPGGVVFLTFHSERTWNATTDNMAFHEMMLRMRIGEVGPCVDEEMLKKPMPGEKVVCWDAAQGRQHLPNVFHSVEHVRRNWTDCFDVLEVIAGGYQHQDVVIMRAR